MSDIEALRRELALEKAKANFYKEQQDKRAEIQRTKKEIFSLKHARGISTFNKTIGGLKTGARYAAKGAGVAIKSTAPIFSGFRNAAGRVYRGEINRQTKESKAEQRYRKHIENQKFMERFKREQQQSQVQQARPGYPTPTSNLHLAMQGVHKFEPLPNHHPKKINKDIYDYAHHPFG